MKGCSVLRQKGPVFEPGGGVTNVNRKWEGPADQAHVRHFTLTTVLWIIVCEWHGGSKHEK